MKNIVALLLVLIPAILYAQFSGGAGEESDPYQITSVTELDSVRNHLDKHFVLVNDLDLEFSSSNGDSGWLPIGSENGDFTGVFNGNNKEIKNLYINRPDIVRGGLFAQTNNATIVNLGIDSCDITGFVYLGGITGYNKGASTIDSCCVTGEISGSYYIGGLVGYNDSSFVYNTYSSADINGETSIGGLIGYNKNSEVLNSYATGEVVGVYNVGGFSGDVRNSTLKNCYSTGSAIGNGGIGGFCGYSHSGLVENCYSMGKVTAFYGIGGLIGSNSSSDIINCFYNKETSYQSDTGKGIPITTEEMLTKNTFTDSGWDFSDVWEIRDGSSSPGLRSLNDAPFIIESELTDYITKNSEDAKILYFYDVEEEGCSLKVDKEPVNGTFSLSNDTLLYTPESEWAGKDSAVISVMDNQGVNTRKKLTLFVFSGGKGTEEEPLMVSTPDELNNIRGFTEKFIVLVDDIDMDKAPYNQGEGWMPIGKDNNNPFKGSFNGNGYKIKNLTINRESKQFCGFFGFCENAVIKNTGIVNCSINGGPLTGGIAGIIIDTSRIDNSYCIGKINGKNYTGGITGTNTASKILQSYFCGEISGQDNTGGIAGNNTGADIDNSYSLGNISGQSYVGGVAGNISSETSIDMCYSSMKISAESDSGGIAANQSSSSVKNTYWDIDRSDIGFSDGGEGKTTEQMMNSSTFTDWDFSEVWEIREGETYPTFKNLNDPPLVFNEYQNSVYGVSVDVQLKGVDPENGELNYIANQSDNGSCTISESLLSYNPDSGFIGVDTISYRAIDSEGHQSYSEYVIINIAPFSKGDGSENDPYQITEVEELYYIRDNLDKCFILMRDLDFKGSKYDSVRSIGNMGWDPVGSDTLPFKGSFDGNGHIIHNLYINRPNQVDVGLFGFTDSAKIVRLGITGCNITGSDYTGVLVGNNMNSEVSEVFTTGRVCGANGGNYAGGITGYNQSPNGIDSAKIKNCYSRVEIREGKYSGGITGGNGYGHIENCYFSGIMKVGDYMGGIVGNTSFSTVLTSYWDTESTGIGSSGTSQGTGVSTEDMMNKTTYTDSGWDFSEAWEIREGETYPGLRSLNDPPVTTSFKDTIIEKDSVIINLSNYSFDNEDEVLGYGIVDTTSNGELRISDSILTYIPETGFCGTERFSYYAEDKEGSRSRKSNIEIDVINFSGGSGTENDPYQITTVNELNGVRYKLDKHFALMNDLDFTGTEYDSVNSVDNMGWRPIGGGGDWNKRFTGSFNGKNNVIRNLYVDFADESAVGLFGYIINAEIESLNIENCAVSGYGYVGGLIGYAMDTSYISNCYVSGRVNGESSVGGITGYNYSYISNCYFKGNVQGSGSQIGGLVGYTREPAIIRNSYCSGTINGGDYSIGGLGGYNYSSRITNCYFTGKILGGNDRIGGLLGSNVGSSIIDTCYVKGNILTDTADYVGGLVGMNSGLVTKCYTDVNINSYGSYSGGLIGYNSGDYGITNCHSLVTIDGSRYVGGLVGYFNSGSKVIDCYVNGIIEGKEKVGGLIAYTSGDVKNCYAATTVKGSSRVGGIAGDVSGDIKNCYTTGFVSGEQYSGTITGDPGFPSTNTIYYNKDISVKSGNSPGVGLTTAEMKHKENYANWDFDTIWEIDEGATFPRLRELYDAPVILNSVEYFKAGSESQIEVSTVGMDNQQISISLKESPPDMRVDENGIITWSPPDSIGEYSVIIVATDGNGYESKKEIIIRVHGFEGKGSKDDPFQISTPGELDSIRYYKDRSFILVNDIDLDVSPYNQEEGWRPIGDYYNRFTGDLNGNNHVIKNLMINRPDNSYNGLFGYMEKAEICSIGIVNCSIRGRRNIGCISGCNSGSKITKSFSSGKLLGERVIGGLIGYDLGSDISKSYTSGYISGGQKTGGLIGSSDSVTEVKKSYSSCYVEGIKHRGGLLGDNASQDIDSSFYSYDIVPYMRCDSGDGIPVTTSELMTESLFSDHGWDFNETWEIREGNTFPGFKGVNDPPVIVLHDSSLIVSKNSSMNKVMYQYFDVEGDSIDFNIITEPDNGDLLLSNDTLYYTPASDWEGRDTITVKAAETESGLYTEMDICISVVPFDEKGTPDDPILVSNAEQLDSIRYYTGKSFRLVNDIDLNQAPYNQGEGWRPIGDYYNPFTGSLDGDGNVVKNLMIKRPDKYSCGFFARIEDAEIKDIGFVNSSVTGERFVGCITGSCISSDIFRSYSSGIVRGKRWVGGITGDNRYNSRISISYFSGSVNGESVIGGIAGRNSDGSYIENCYSSGSVSGDEGAGGIVGGNIRSSLIHKTFSASIVKGVEKNAGIVGSNSSEVTHSFYSYDIYSSDENDSTKGIPVSDEELKSESLFSSLGWDFSEVWEIDEGETFPGLRALNDLPFVVIHDSLRNVQPNTSDNQLITDAFDVEDDSLSLSIYRDPSAGEASVTGQNLVYTPETDWSGIDSLTLRVNENSSNITNEINIHLSISNFKGNGTESNPFEIYTASGLDSIRYCPDRYYEIMNDIDLDVAPYNMEQGWNPICRVKPFTGGIDGNGFKIENLYINSPGLDKTGLLGWIKSGNIDSLGVVRADITAGEYTASIAGVAEDNSVISNCYSKGEVKGEHKVSGLIAHIDNSDINKCYSSGLIEGNDDVGGLVGYAKDYSSNIRNCYSNGRVYGNEYIGGLIGRNDDSNIENCYSYKYVNGESETGGLVGNGDDWDVENSFWDIESSDQESSAGGTGRHADTLMIKENYTEVGWDFEDVWEIRDGRTFPGLRALNEPPFLTMNSGARLIKTYTDTTVLLTVTDRERDGFSCTITENPVHGEAGFNNDTLFYYLNEDVVGRDTIGIMVSDTNDNTIKKSIVLELVDYKGNGTENDPFQVTTAEQLSNMRMFPDKSYILMNDIDLDQSSYNSGEGWEPIGDNESRFTGRFNGDGHLISNLYINRTEQDFIGLFGVADNADIDKLGLVNIDVKGGSYTGGLIGFSRNSTNVKETYTAGKITGTDRVGGLMGENNSSHIYDSYSGVDVSGKDYNIGGLVGYNVYSGRIYRCYSFGTVNHNGRNIGGLVGKSQESNAYSSFWNKITSGVDNSAGGTGIETEQMMAESLFTESGWDFESVWEIREGETFPGLKDIDDSPFIINSNARNLINISSRDNKVFTVFDVEGNDFNHTFNLNPVNGTAEFVNDSVYYSPDMGWSGKDSIEISVTDSYGRKNSKKAVIRVVTFSNGTGTPEDPFQITNVNQLDSIRYFPDRYYEIMNDIDLDVAPYNQGEGWTPICGSKPFTGHIDGNGYKIKNLFINRPVHYKSGLFGWIKQGETENLGIVNVDVTAVDYTAALAGVAEDNSVISNCYSSGEVNGKHKVSGLVARIKNSDLVNCYSSCLVKGNDDLGGLGGYANYGSSIRSCYSNGRVYGNKYVGGLVGRNEKSGIEICYSSALVKGEYDVGGLVGYTKYSSSEIRNCYSNGRLYGNKYVGGLVGNNEYSDIENCYSYTYVNGISETGGLVGKGSDLDVDNSFWDIESSDQESSAGGTGRHADTLMIKENYTEAGWDFEEVWEIKDGYTSPGLRALNEPPFLNMNSGAKVIKLDTDTAMILTVSDREGDSFSCSITESPVHGNAEFNNDTLFYYITDDIIGRDSIGIMASDTNDNIGRRMITLELVDYKGNGTENDPFQVTTAEQLSNIKMFPDKSYILMNDIDLDQSPYNNGEGWEPIGDNESRFTGMFNGDGHIINNLYINRTEQEFIGLFGVADNAEIHKLGLVNIDVKGGSYTGGLIGFSRNSTNLKETYTAGKITGTDRVGGLMGENNSSYIYDSYSGADVSGKEYNIGGLVGYNVNSGSISRCYSFGTVNHNGRNIGGLVGKSQESNVYNSFWNKITSGVDNSAGGTGVETEQMMAESLFTESGWDFESVWEIREGEAFPGLKDIDDSPFIINSNARDVINISSRDNKIFTVFDVEGNDFNHTFDLNPVNGTAEFVNDSVYYSPDMGWSGKDSIEISVTDSLGRKYNKRAVIRVVLFSNGAGTPEDPFQITNANQLDSVRNYLDKSYILMNDINLNKQPYNSDKGWDPVGDFHNRFSGSLDGGGHVIKKLYINRPQKDRCGLFGHINNGEIKNLGVTGCNINGHNTIGGVAGELSDSSIIEKCFSTGEIDGNTMLGGVSGYIYGESEITNSYSNAYIKGNAYIGGIAGRVYTSSLIENCYSCSEIDANNNIGGISGFASESEIKNCYYNSEITGLNDTAQATPLSSIEMMNKSLFTESGWDFNNIWEIKDNKTFPGLKVLNDPPFVAVNSHQEIVMNNIDTIDVYIFDTDTSDITVEYTTTSNMEFEWMDSLNILVCRPDSDYVGDESIVYRVSDGEYNMVKRVVISVDNILYARNDFVSIEEDEEIVVSPLSNDESGGADSIWIQSLSNNKHGSVEIRDSLVFYNPEQDYNGSDTIRYVIMDEHNGVDTAGIFIEIDPVNDPPVTDSLRLFATEKEAPVDFTLSASDVDNDTTVFSIIDSCDYGNISGTLPDMVYTPQDGFGGRDSIVYIASDSMYSDTGTIDIVIGTLNAVDDTVNVLEDRKARRSLKEDILDNDDYAGVENVLVEDFTGSAFGETFTDEYSFFYTPLNDYYGNDTVNYIITDRFERRDTGTIWIFIEGENDNPFAGSRGLEFNGDNEFVSLKNINYTGEYDEITVESWINTEAGKNGNIVSFDNKQFFALRTFSSDNEKTVINWSVHTDDGELDIYDTSRINDGKWHYIAAVYDDGDASVYIDGKPSVSGEKGRAFGETGVTRYGFIGEGSKAEKYNGSKRNSRFKGRIDEIRIWDRNLTESEIERHSINRMISDESGLAGYWPMDKTDKNEISDYSVSGNNGIIKNADRFEKSQEFKTYINTPITIQLPGSDADFDNLIFDIIDTPGNGNLDTSLPVITYTPDSSFWGVETLEYTVSDGNSKHNGEVSFKVWPSEVDITFKLDISELQRSGLIKDHFQPVVEVFNGFFAGSYKLNDENGDSVWTGVVTQGAPCNINYAFAIDPDGDGQNSEGEYVYELNGMDGGRNVETKKSDNSIELPVKVFNEHQRDDNGADYDVSVLRNFVPDGESEKSFGNTFTNIKIGDINSGELMNIQRYSDSIGGQAPDDIEVIAKHHYWEYEKAPYNSSSNPIVSIDHSMITGVKDPYDLRILNRANEEEEWSILSSELNQADELISAELSGSRGQFILASVDSVNQLKELMPGIVSQPYPADDQESVSVRPRLSWKTGSDNMSYDVHLKADHEDEPWDLLEQELTSEHYQVMTNLEHDSTYLWKVVSKNTYGSTDGPVWSFRTEILPDIEVTSIDVPDTALANNKCEITWEVRNNSDLTGTSVEKWYDVIYFSHEPEFSPYTSEKIGKFRNMAYLNPGESYVNTQDIRIPKGQVGSKYIFIMADAGNALKEYNEDNNRSRSSDSIITQIPPYSDLKPCSLAVQSDAFEGDVINMQVKVVNEGEAPAFKEKPWKDYIYLSKDSLTHSSPKYGISDVWQKSRKTNPEFGNYISCNVTSPIEDAKIRFGDKILDVSKDRSSETINKWIVCDPEYCISTCCSPFELPEGGVAYCNPDYCSECNESDSEQGSDGDGGTSEGEELMIDSSVYVSYYNYYAWVKRSNPIEATSGLYSDNDHVYSKTPYTLNSGKSYKRNYKVKIPMGIESGTYYLHYSVDKNDNQYEYDKEDNNTICKPLEIKIHPPPDLKPVSITTNTDTVFAGSDMDVSWEVENAGYSGVSDKYWVDALYLSRDTVISEDDIKLGSKPSNVSSLKVDSSYSQTLTFSIPENLSDNYHIILRTDSKDRVLEHRYEDNNTMVKTENENKDPVFIQNKFVDIKADSVWMSQDTVHAGDKVDVYWRAENIGTKSAEKTWYDQLYFSEDVCFKEEYNNGTNRITNKYDVAEKRIDHALDTGESYTKHVEYTIPYSAGGESFFYYISDKRGSLFQNGNRDNDFVRSVFGSCDYNGFWVIPEPQCDLDVTELNVDSVMYSNQSYHINYRVENTGAGRTVERWKDNVYLSKDSVIDRDDDVLIRDVKNGTDILKSEEYYSVDSANIDIPCGISGTYYIIVVTGVEKNRGDNLNEVDTLNNILYQKVDVKLSTPVDLQALTFNVPEDVYASKFLRLTWEVKNNNEGVISGSWYDQVYLSKTKKLSNDSKKLAYKRNSDTLMYNESYVCTARVEIPSYTLGNYYLIVKIDSHKKDNIYEHLAEDNNEIVRQVNISKPPPVDLEISEIMVPDTVRPGMPFSFDYVLKNIGDTTASGWREDAFYASSDTLLNAEDPMLGLFRGDLALPAGDSVIQNVEFGSDVHGLRMTNYKGAGRADLKNQIVESDDENNMAFSNDSFYLSVDELQPDTLINSFVSDSGFKYYRIEFEQDKDVYMTLTGSEEYDENEIYVSYEEIPSYSQYHYASNKPFSRYQEVIIPGTDSGSYYIKIKNIKGSGSFSIKAEQLDFCIKDISPDTIGNDSRITCRVMGAGFREYTSWYIRLSEVSEDFPDSNFTDTSLIEVDKKQMINTMQYELSFEFNNIKKGKYDVIAVNNDTSRTVLNNGLYIDESSGMVLKQMQVSFPNKIRLGNSPKTLFSELYKNTGNVNIDYAVAKMVMPDNGNVLSLVGEGNLLSSDIYSYKGTKIIKLLFKDITPGEEIQVSFIMSGIARTEGGGVQSGLYHMLFTNDCYDQLSFVNQMYFGFRFLKQMVLNEPGASFEQINSVSSSEFIDSVFTEVMIPSGVVDGDKYQKYVDWFGTGDGFELDYYDLGEKSPSEVYSEIKYGKKERGGVDLFSDEYWGVLDSKWGARDKYNPDYYSYYWRFTGEPSEVFVYEKDIIYDYSDLSLSPMLLLNLEAGKLFDFPEFEEEDSNK